LLVFNSELVSDGRRTDIFVLLRDINRALSNK